MIAADALIAMIHPSPSAFQLRDVRSLVRHVRRSDVQRRAGGGHGRGGAVLIPLDGAQGGDLRSIELDARLVHMGRERGRDAGVLEDRAIGGRDAHRDGVRPGRARASGRTLDIRDVHPLRHISRASDGAAVGVLGTGVQVHVADLCVGDARTAEDRGCGGCARDSGARIPLC